MSERERTATVSRRRSLVDVQPVARTDPELLSIARGALLARLLLYLLVALRDLPREIPERGIGAQTAAGLGVRGLFCHLVALLELSAKG
jgi:hypothetical protein